MCVTDHQKLILKYMYVDDQKYFIIHYNLYMYVVRSGYQQSSLHIEISQLQFDLVQTLGVFTWTRITFRKTFRNVIQNVIGIVI